MQWVDHADPAVVAAVTGDTAATPRDAQTDAALQEATDLLVLLTGHLVHPAGEATEEFTAYPMATRLSLTWRPVTAIVSVTLVHPDCSEEVLDPLLWCAWQGGVRRQYTGAEVRPYPCLVETASDRLRLTYQYGSTITAAALAALMRLAHQFYLLETGSAECALPERITSVNREGLSFSLVDPMTFLDKGLTGVPAVDQFLTAINPSKALRPSGVWTPQSPPGVTVGMRPVAL